MCSGGGRQAGTVGKSCSRFIAPAIHSLVTATDDCLFFNCQGILRYLLVVERKENVQKNTTKKVSITTHH